MLVNFSFENFLSFRDEAEFSMIAGRVAADADTLTVAPTQRSMKILPVSAVFGGNASGKSNFVRALAHLRNMVLSGKPGYCPFRLDAARLVMPSSFTVCLMADERVWEYSLSVDRGEVVHEQLLLIRQTTETEIFSRSKQYFSWNPGLKLPQGEAEKISTLGEALTPATLFIHAAQSFQLPGMRPWLDPVFRWFQDTLCILQADTRRDVLGDDLRNNLQAYSSALAGADTNVGELQLLELDIRDLHIDSAAIDSLNRSGDMVFSPSDASVILARRDDGIHAYRCLSIHTDAAGRKVPFLITDESDGTRRLLHLLPVLVDGRNTPRVYVVDELDRSLHTALSRYLLEQQLELARTVQNNRRQLIFTTHDVMLMDQSLLRRDELWAVERGRDGASRLIPFEEFVDIRKDKNIRRSYLTGHMGGLPRIPTIAY